jgi:hypothetical protein
VNPQAEGFDFFLEAEFLSLEFLEAELIRRRSSHLVVDQPLESLMTITKFANASIQRHSSAPLL